MRLILEGLEELGLTVTGENTLNAELLSMYRELVDDGELFPLVFCDALKSLWNDPVIVQTARENLHNCHLDKSVTFNAFRCFQTIS